MNHDVFITFHNHDIEVAKKVCHALEQNKIKCWVALRDIPPGSNYGDAIGEAFRSCKVVVVLFSDTAAASQWVKNELNVAFEEQKKIIVFALDKTPMKDQYRFMLQQARWIDAFPDYRTKVNELVLSVSQSIGKSTIGKTNIQSSMKRNFGQLLVICMVLLIIGVVVSLYLLFVK